MNVTVSLAQFDIILGDPASNLDKATDWVQEAARREIAVLDLVLNNHDIRELYGARMVLVRPDQIIGWRGSDCANPVELWQLLMGQREWC